MPEFIDQMGSVIVLPSNPKRIISLVPSQTELLYDLGLDEEVIGITKFCIHPQKWFNKKTHIGGTKNCNIELIKKLQPDLILANKEENIEVQIEAMRAFAPVWVSDITNYLEAKTMIQSIGNLVGKPAETVHLIAAIETAFEQLPSHPLHPTVAYIIWKDPYMTVGVDTFIHHILSMAGYQNVFANHKRYPEISIHEIQEASPDLIFLSSEPYPFKMKQLEELQILLPNSKIHLVNGEMFSWYGSRLKYTPGYLVELMQSIDALSNS